MKSEHLYKHIIDSAPNAFIVIDINGLIVFINQETEKLFQYSSNELIGEKVERLIPERFRPNHPKLRKDYFENPVPRAMGAGRELFGLRKNQSEFPIEIGLRPLKVDSKILILGSIIDISERKKIEEQFRTIVENSSDAIITKDLEGRITSWNPGAQEIFGFTAREAIGHFITDLIFPPNKLEEENKILEPLKGGGKIENLETVRKTKDGKVIQVSIALSPLRNERQEIVGVLKVARDITKNKNELLLQEVHHRIKNNLTIITSLIEMEIRRKQDSSPEVLELGRSAINRIASIARLHERIYSSKVFNNINLKDYLKELSQDLMSNLNTSLSTPLSLKVKTQDEATIFIQIEKAIPSGLILVEFLTNTLKHAFPKEQLDRKIEVLIQYDSTDHITIHLRDNGRGIPLDLTHDNSKRKSLGLTIINTLCEQIESKPIWKNENGTVLSFKFKNEGVLK